MMMSQNIGLSKVKSQIPFGTVFTENFATLTNWTSVGGGSFTPNASTGLTIGAGGTDFNRWIEYDPYPNTLENFSINLQVEVLAVGIVGVSVQTLRSVAGAHKKTFFGSFFGAATNGRSVISTYADGGSVSAVTAADAGAPGTINYAVGHFLNLVFRRSSINTYDFICTNVNNGTTSSVGYSDIPDSAPIVVAANNACKFAVQCISGSFRVVPGTFSVTSNDYRNVRALFIGDSRTTFMSAAPATNRYANKVFAGSKQKYIVDAGAYDTTGQYSVQTTHIPACQADYVFMMIGRNDIFYSISSGTWQANYDAIRNMAASKGSKIVHLLVPTDSSANVTALNSYVNSTWAQDIIIDMSGHTFTYADGVHFTNTDHQYIADQILLALPKIIY